MAVRLAEFLFFIRGRKSFVDLDFVAWIAAGKVFSLRFFSGSLVRWTSSRVFHLWGSMKRETEKWRCCNL